MEYAENCNAMLSRMLEKALAAGHIPAPDAAEAAAAVAQMTPLRATTAAAAGIASPSIEGISAMGSGSRSGSKVAPGKMQNHTQTPSSSSAIPGLAFSAPRSLSRQTPIVGCSSPNPAVSSAVAPLVSHSASHTTPSGRLDVLAAAKTPSAGPHLTASRGLLAWTHGKSQTQLQFQAHAQSSAFVLFDPESPGVSVASIANRLEYVQAENRYRSSLLCLHWLMAMHCSVVQCSMVRLGWKHIVLIVSVYFTLAFSSFGPPHSHEHTRSLSLNISSYFLFYVFMCLICDIHIGIMVPGSLFAKTRI